jgi:hypothetical protein
MTLAEYLQAGASEPFKWGRTDCVRFACDWVKRQRGVDPAEAFRGSYFSEADADAHLAAGGGLEALARRRMAAVGVPETANPQPRDVGIVKMPTGNVAAIKTPIGWAVKSNKGIVVKDMPVLVAWSL